MNKGKTAIVAGGMGVCGRAMVEQLSCQTDWKVYALSRRSPDFSTPAKYISVDLENADDCQLKLGNLSEVTHVFYAANQTRQNVTDQVHVNLGMLKNFLSAIEAASPNLEHISLMHGMKAYGNMLGPFKTPALETDPRVMPPMFYYDQEDLIRSSQVGKRWTWSTLRPGAIAGVGSGSGANLIAILGVYGTLCKALGIPFWYPGTLSGFTALRQLSDASLLARQSFFIATTQGAENQVFNVNNGGYYRWENIWSNLARFFDIEPAGPLNIRLKDFMADKGPAWDQILKEYGLQKNPYNQVVNWNYSDTFHNGWDSIANTNKIRKLGFNEVINDDECLLNLLSRMRSARVIP